MTLPDQLFHRAYTLVEAGVPLEEAIDDLLAIANGNASALGNARFLLNAVERHSDFDGRAEALELIGWDQEVLEIEKQRRRGIATLLAAAQASTA